MAVRRRGKRWIADYYDGFRIRRWKTFDTKDDAKNHEAQQRVQAGEDGALAPSIDPDISLSSYAVRWLKDCEARGVKPKTIVRSESALRLHILPQMGGLKVREVSRPIVRQFLLVKLSDEHASRQGLRTTRDNVKRQTKRLSRGTVKHLFMILSGTLSSAVEDGIIKTNPVRGLWKSTGKAGKAEGARRTEEILAFDAEEAGRFLAVARTETPEHFPAFATMMLAGLRVGEVMALMPAKVDQAKKRIRVDIQLTGTPKDNEARSVEMAQPLAAILADAVKARGTTPKVVSITGHPHGSESIEAGPWLFYPELGPNPTGTDEQRIYKSLKRAFDRVLKLANLPRHHTPKSLRHTFGSQLISRGISPAYVQQQLGHSSIQITVDVYGSWLPVQAPGALDGFATSVLTDGSGMVATAGF
jgi:integrase